MLRNNGRHNFRSPFTSQVPVPSLTLDFAATGTLDSRITFTRSTTATYYNSSGVLSTAAINAARFTYNPVTLTALGLLNEQSSTNLILYSGAIGGTGWSLSGATANLNAAIGPDGYTVMTKLVETATTTNHRVSFSTTVTTTTYAYSIFAKAAERNNIMMLMVAGAGYILQNFNLLTGTVQSSGSFGSTITAGTPIITSIGNGIYRCTMIATVVTGVSVMYGCDVAKDNTTSTNYAGTAGFGIYIWGAQLELTIPTSYIPTTIAQGIRAADTPFLPIDTWYNTSQGTWFAQVNMLSNAGTPRIVGATPSSKAPILISSQAAAMFDSTTNISTANTITANIDQKIATSWTGTTGLVCLNGGTVATGSQSTGYADVSTIGIGYNSTSNNNFINGTIAKITYYQQALTSAQLQTLTT